MKSILLILTLFIFNNLCGQTTWYISTAGSDTNSGMMAGDAFATVNQAIGSATCGDSIYVMGGTYHEKINAYKFCPENSRIIVQGDLSDRPLIIGDSTVTNKYAIGASGSGYVFRHLELTSPYPNICSQSNMVIVGKGDYFDFIDLIVHHSGYDGIKTTSDCSTNDFPIGWRILNSEIHSNGLGCPASIVNGDGIDLTECRNCLIENSIIRDNKGHQIQVKLEAKNVTIQNCHIEGINMIQIGLPGNTPQCDPMALNADSVFIRNNTMLAKGDTNEFVIKMADVQNVFIENNTIIKDSVTVDVGFICFGGCGSNTNWQFAPKSPTIIRNNIFYSRATMPFFAGPDTTFYDPLGVLGKEVTSSYNLFYDLNGSYLTPPDNSSTSFIADPLFCNYPINFELSQGSPCIDAGDPGSLNDPDMTQNDIGAIYYQTSCVLAISKNVIEPTMEIFPNPSNGNVIVRQTGIQAIIGSKLNLYNSVGQYIMSISIESNEQYLHLESLEPGIYFYRFMPNDFKIMESGKLIINQ